MQAPLLLLVACLAVAAGLELGKLQGYSPVWQIGRFDGSPGEFALAPGDARQFTRRFAEDPVFVVGHSKPDDWPFIHPSEADTAWGGRPRHEFTIVFHLHRRPSGRYALVVALTDVHERLVPEMDLRVNGHLHRRRLKAGAGRAYYGDFAHASPQTVWVEFDAAELRMGKNEVTVALQGGSWVAYDALALLRREGKFTAGRKPRARAHALTELLGPIHQDFDQPEGWHSDLLALQGQAGWLAMVGAAGQAATVPGQVPDEHFQVSFDLRVAQGAMALEYGVEHAIAPYWRVRWDDRALALEGAQELAMSPGTWRLKVASEAGRTYLEAQGPDGRRLKVGPVSHLPGPPGRLRFVVLKDLAQAYVTNLHVTRAVTLRATGAHDDQGQRVQVRLETRAPHGEARATVLGLGRDGQVLAQRVATWREEADEVTAVLRPQDDAEVQQVKVELRQTGRRGPFWVLQTPVVGGEPEAQPGGEVRPAGAYALSTERGWVVGNSTFEVLLPTAGELGPALLVDRADGTVLANEAYSYAPLGPQVPARVTDVEVRHDDETGAVEAAVTARAGTVAVRHLLVFPASGPSFAERLEFTVAPEAEAPLDLSRARCGWVRTLPDRRLRTASAEVRQARLVPVPWRRDTWGKLGLLDLTLTEALWRQGWYRQTGSPAVTWVPEHGSEGWLWDRGRGGTLIVKLNEAFMEWALIDRVMVGGHRALRFGGCGVWHGDPQAWAAVAPGQKVTGGWTYYVHYDGDWRQGFYAFRELMARHGHGCPFDFDPPVHWNELYDNRLWWGPDTPARRKKYYTLRDMLWEAEKAHQAHCQALYLDPGWDTVFGSHLWAEDRLGTAEGFAQRLSEEFGLKVSLHTPVAHWASSGGGGATYPPEAWRVDEQGNVIRGSLCSGARAYLEEEARRLTRLADAGAVYFMFDGSAYTGPCFSREHGHPVPYTRDDHVAALRRLAQLVHERHPEVIIEQHDQIVAGVHSVYVPVYLGHGDGGWDERWANEYMWRPLEDLKSGRALSLYYYNLAYHLPLYLHLDLRDDNEHCLALWWYASTCRHLGIGGTHPDGRNWLQVQRQMARYVRLQDFYKRGVFYGLDEQVHVHVLPDRGAVINVFNLSDREAEKRFFLDLAEVGIKPARRIYVRGAEHVRLGTGLELTVRVPPWGAEIVEVRVKK